MRRAIAAAVIAASAATSACGRTHAVEEGDGPTVARNYQVGNFEKIEVAGPYDVDIRTGPSVSVSGRGSEKLMERTVVEVRGNKLIIHPEERRGWFHVGWTSHGKANFTVTVPRISGATIAGSGDIKVDRVQGDRFEGTVAGSGGINIEALDVQALKLAIAGSGGVKAAGKAQSAEYEIAGSGDVDAGDIALQQVKVSIMGSGDVRAQASGTADVSIMGSGNVNVKGGAKCSVSKAGSGSVTCS